MPINNEPAVKSELLERMSKLTTTVSEHSKPFMSAGNKLTYSNNTDPSSSSQITMKSDNKVNNWDNLITNLTGNK